MNTRRSGQIAGLVIILASTAAWSLEPSPEADKGDRERSERQARQQQLMEISCRDDQSRPAGWLDMTYSYINQRLCEPAAWFDGFFGDPRTLEENPVGSFIRLRNSARWDETEGWRYRVGVRANLILPNLSERVRLLIARDEELDGDYTDTGAFDDPENRTRLGLRVIASERTRSRFDVDGTVRVSSGSLNPRIRGRYRHIRGLSDSTLGRFTQSAFWEREEGFGLTSRVDWEWLPNRDQLVRLSAYGTWSEESAGIDWRSSLVSFRQLDTKSALRGEIGAWGFTRPQFETEEYFVAVRYRRQFLHPWLFYEIEPEHAWPRDFDTGERRSDWRLTFTIEIQFENQRSRQHRLQRYLGDEEVDPEQWEDQPIPVDAPGHRAEDPVLKSNDDENDADPEGGD